ncbi:MFS transporter [Arthrobacter sp. SLBN-53]|uniref:MFS transporter n=1 Tax=Arthrobacter sp. SLBN-53 TaxID=2768412 RepID=UPI00114E08C2|nr:MFS transporter [Arthrobacter sp. SLBN-53]TQK30666.1 MFS transporter [Arthrobacter sp. SLBN-53]
MVDTLSEADHATGSMPQPSAAARRWTLTVACLGVLLVISSMIGLNTALPDLATSTSATQTQLTWIVDSYTLVLACLLLPAGALGDRYGRRGALLVGLSVFGIASIAPAIWSDPLHLIIARGAAGAGAALVMPATLSLITTAYPKDQRNKAVGIWAGAAGSGAIIGMLGSGAILHFWPWQVIFWAFSAAAAALFVLALTIATSKESVATALDWAGAMLIGSGLAAVVFAILEVPARGWSDALVIGCLSAGVALVGAFAIWELRCEQPLLDIRLFADPAFATGAATITVFFLSMFGYFFIIVQHMQLILGYTPIKTAMALTPLVGPVLLLSTTAFWYLPRVGLRAVVFTGSALVAIGFALMSGVSLGDGYGAIGWPMLVMSAGIGLLTTPATSAIMSTVSDDKQGVASAVNDTTREVGAALGIALAGSLLAAKYTEALAPALPADLPPPVREAVTGSLGQALEVSAALGPRGAAVAELAESAFVESMSSALLVMALVVGISAVVLGFWAPGRDGRQLAVLRVLRGTGKHRR